MPLLGQQPAVSDFLEAYHSSIPLPTAILIITAHWITDTIQVSAAPHGTKLYFDYGGFSPESYEYTYPAPGSPDIANKVCRLLKTANIPCAKDTKRGWDHGVFVPLKLMYPDANVPVVAMSIHTSLDPAFHVNMGKALAQLREEGVLIIGSGASFHNFDYFFTRDQSKRAQGMRHSHTFNNYLIETLTSDQVSAEDREARLVDWATAPSARDCHKVNQEEHLIPLHVIAGAGRCGQGTALGPVSGSDEFAISNFEWR